MTYDTAISQAQQLRTALLDHGVRAVSIELHQGRGGSGWVTPTRWVGTMGHHIATRRTQGNTPGLALIKTGRADLPGPLCNGYGGFDEIARIICMAWANHPGQGGPWTFPIGTVPANNGRPYIFGWEFEGGLNAADFTDSYRDFMARCHAGTLAWLGQPVGAHIEHKTWAPGRKIDRLGYTLTQARDEITKEMQTMTSPTFKGATDIGAHAGVDPDLKGAWDRALAAGVATAHTVPDDISTAEQTIAYIDRYHTRVVAPQLAALEARIAELEARTTGGGLQRGDQVTLA